MNTKEKDDHRPLTNQEIRIKAIELSDIGMGPDLNYAKRIEHYIKTGEINSHSSELTEQPNKAAKSV